MRRDVGRLVLLVAGALVAAGCTSDFTLTLGDPAGASQDAPAVAAPPTTTTTTTTTTAAPPITTVPLDPLVLGFAGDVQMVGDTASRGPLEGVAHLLSAPDLMFANLETVVADRGEVGRPPIDKRFIFLSPPETLDQLHAAGVDVVGLANNHTWDYGPAGAVVTRARVDESSLVGTGAGAGPDEAYAPQFLDVEGRRVGVVSLTLVPCDWSRERAAERPEVAWACDRFALGALASLSEAVTGSDLTVVLLHAGVEVSDCPGPRLREIVEVWVDLGADVVAISHPHVLQGVEVVDAAAVLWSTGNFAFQNGGGRTARSAVFEVTIGDGVEQIRVIPTVLPGAIAAPADVATAALVREEVSARSRGGRVGDDGVLVADPTPSRCD